MDWNAVSAISNIAVAFTTLVAALVALWSATYAYRAKIKLQFNANTIIARPGSGVIDKSICVTVTNKSARDVTVHSWGMLFKRHHKRIMIIENTVNPLYSSLPATIPVDGSLNLQYGLSNFRDVLVMQRDKGDLGPTEQVWFYVVYGPSKRKKVRTGMKVSEAIAAADDLLCDR